jgi:hypothetical protein
MFIDEPIPLGWIDDAEFKFFNDGEKTMSKGQDSKKAVKKEPTKTTKEKKADKKIKQEQKKRQGP